MPPRRTLTLAPTRRRQHGISLFVVLILVMLAMLLALWASRSALFNQMIVGNDADYQRAFAAAQAMLQDAELDVLRKNPDGSVCTKDASKPKVCRSPGAGVLYPPVGAEDVGPLVATLSAVADTQCKDGLCSKRVAAQDFWADSALMAKLQKSSVGARYGEYTGAKISTSTSELGAEGNAILNQTGDGNVGAWYWTEVLPYTGTATSGGLIVGNDKNLLPLNVNPLVVYRVTAVAYGRKNGTRVVLQQTFAPQKLKD
ncbi:pilus assembly PilX family protein [Ottowia testudinis]|uniref:Pilus assembly protein PilX n=1 Tax=Ottowia testudinis TaxID=2816950 RepID=A0A975H2G1_9BURK|nr:PilX N-terminal domain-containing pilus assembly protein [Ottowia testudinis]QTD44764.1 pilus assembly protein PilX [Ottowia testudinis]